ncbi:MULTISPECIES: hypothetical protein [Bacillus cereus group]|uniref:Uncharacterized protein n=1 Tax=Bacillus cereus TaxID=1396 RepID=A0A9W7QFI1_BACCE|nr:hypothetical protein [Bacillus cereus]KAB2395362.1 hypothetical protein F8172_14915 [Bacillus cereus]KAB2408116.1 hypothetical protein F8170_09915 [Bacillus cereus]KAB2430925.1 hypothetical protein F8168_06385 [Bacillus cereus]
MGNIIINFSKLSMYKILLGKKFIGTLVYLFILPFLIIKLSNWSADSNAWNSIFFIFGNRYIYFLSLITPFLLLLDEIENGNNIQYCVNRFLKKKHVILSQILTMFMISIILTIYLFSVVVGQSFLFLGFDLDWSIETQQQLDFYTSFASSLTPLESLPFFILRYFFSLIFIGSFYFYWQSITNRGYMRIGMLLILFYLFANAVFNFINIPVLSIIDISQSFVYQYKQEKEIVPYLAQNHCWLLGFCLILQFYALLLCKKVRY